MKKVLFLMAFCFLSMSALLAQRTITGNVTSKDGEILYGVNVNVQGSDPVIVTTTDIDGNYSIKVPSDKRVLVYTYMGYETLYLTVGDDSNVLDAVMPSGVE